MAYTKQNYQDGQVLTAAKLNAMDAQIAENEIAVRALGDFSEIERKLKFLYELTRGQAWDYETDSAEAYSKAIPSGARMASVNAIGGRSFEWNQLFTNIRSISGHGVTVARVDDYSVSVKGTVNDVSGDMNIYFYTPRYAVDSIPGHKYLFFTNGYEKLKFYVYGGITPVATQRDIVTGNTDAKINMTIRLHDYAEGESIDTVVTFLMTDLTATFGSGSEPTTVEAAIAAYKALGIDITQPQPYSAGEIRHTAVESVVTRGMNLCPENGWTQGNINSTTGAIIQREPPYTNAFSDVFEIPDDKIEYYCRSPYPVSGENAKHYYVFCYDENMGFLGRGSTPVYIRNTTFKVIPGTKYVRILIYGLDGAFYVADLLPCCINISSSRNGTHKTYRTPITQPIPASVLALDGYGWGIGSNSNRVYRDGNRWIFRKPIRKVVLDSSAPWQSAANRNGIIHYIARPAMTSAIPAGFKNNAICDILNASSFGYAEVTGYVGIISSMSDGKSAAVVPPMEIATVNDFKTWIGEHPITLYYTSSDVEEIDITDLMLNAIDPTDVEAGGSITFESESKAAVPNEVEYLLKLSEVG